MEPQTINQPIQSALKTEFKKSGTVVALAYIMLVASIVALFQLFFATHSFFDGYLWILISPIIFICTFIPIITSVFSVLVIRSKNEHKYKVAKRFLIAGICIMPFLFTFLIIWGN